MSYCFILELEGEYFKTWSVKLRRKALERGYNSVLTIKGKDISVSGKRLKLLPNSARCSIKPCLAEDHLLPSRA